MRYVFALLMVVVGLMLIIANVYHIFCTEGVDKPSCGIYIIIGIICIFGGYAEYSNEEP